MVARIYALIFLAILVFGFIYQESYMQMSMSEFSQKVDTDKFPLDVFSMTPLHVRQYKNGIVTAEMTAAEGRLVTTGRFTAQGGVVMRMTDPNAPPAEQLTLVKSPKIIASMQKANGLATDLFSGQAKFERVEIPGQAEIVGRGHVLSGQSFFIDVPNMTLVTKEPVKVTAENRRIEAQGAEVELRTRAFKFTGPVRGTETPPPAAPREKRKKRSRASEPVRHDVKGRSK